MKDPSPHKICHHGVLQSKCDKRPKINENLETDEDIPSLCQTEDDFKYKIIRVSVEEIDVSLVEASCCCNVKVMYTHRFLNIIFYPADVIYINTDFTCM